MATADSSLFPRDLGKDCWDCLVGALLKSLGLEVRVKDNVGLVSTKVVL